LCEQQLGCRLRHSGGLYISGLIRGFVAQHSWLFEFQHNVVAFFA
jgi:hypothetical protein